MSTLGNNLLAQYYAQQNADPWKDWDIVLRVVALAGDTFAPYQLGYYDVVTIDYGDGTVADFPMYTSISLINHTYASDGEYFIKIKQGDNVRNTSFRSCAIIHGVEKWLMKPLEVNNTYCFYATNVEYAKNIVCKAANTKLYRAFLNCSNLVFYENCTFIGGNCLEMFSNCKNLVTMAEPSMWWQNQSWTSYNHCFRNCTKIANYNDIPTDWK